MRFTMTFAVAFTLSFTIYGLPACNNGFLPEILADRGGKGVPGNSYKKDNSSLSKTTAKTDNDMDIQVRWIINDGGTAGY
jgi:hypothetical protein